MKRNIVIFLIILILFILIALIAYGIWFLQNRMNYSRGGVTESEMSEEHHVAFWDLISELDRGTTDKAFCMATHCMLGVGYDTVHCRL
ncbi:uncharacterized protein K452DRAFT_302727 [Aplosporella prunicola CBS 121167]|uniref:Uncharacterized protein n=1 Tax=Aplosporella prunicola CBS 121167 TaxID=1176127 RepID=A0A6A6AZ34_9PEZI|nr:uncharacterized protein K452DRAFT_302727 [Aplosporella prunicola CBS 121167]KAF2136453.1 hypothetical protein K452DRAFT_302727 [Aplosporella prunicola CBS 121167]